MFDCTLIIKNIIWKNIISYEIIDDQQHIYMYHNEFRYIHLANRYIEPHLSYDILLGTHMYYNHEKKNNFDILQTKIINYMMLVDIIVRENMIYDLVCIFKMYMFDVILVL